METGDGNGESVAKSAAPRKRNRKSRAKQATSAVSGAPGSTPCTAAAAAGSPGGNAAVGGVPAAGAGGPGAPTAPSSAVVPDVGCLLIDVVCGVNRAKLRVDGLRNGSKTPCVYMEDDSQQLGQELGHEEGKGQIPRGEL